jgi:nicotinamide mononucleotide adenylyltransferase
MPQTLEERVTLLEQEVKELRRTQKPADSEKGNNRWVNAIFGAFKEDPLFEEAVKAGEEYRKAQIPDYMKDDTSTHVPS